MNTKDNTRSKSIRIMTTAKEKSIISNNAQEFGGTVSEYIRTKILSDSTEENGKVLQALVALLCHHSRFIEGISDENIRKPLEHWEGTVWQLL